MSDFLQEVPPSVKSRAATHSQFVSGSFSGADIKVVLTYPINSKTAETEIRRLRARIEELQRERDNLNTEDLLASDQPNRQGRLFRMMMSREEQIKILERKISTLDEWAEKANQLAATKTIAELQTISWSIFREKSPVRPLGSVYPRSIVRGPRTIAGTMVFTLFDKSALYDILTLGLNPYSTGTHNDRDYYVDSTGLIDQLPPLDLIIIASNEYGNTSYMNLWGVDFMNDGGTFSIEDLFSETVVQYTARDIDLLRPTIGRQHQILRNITDTGHRKTAKYVADDSKIRTTIARRNPYI